MQVGTRLVDGQRDGYTGAQYANSAYRVPPKWTNKAELKAGGTIRVMNNKIIYPGEEILFAYHADYWKRWGMNRQRGRKAKQSPTAQETNASKMARATSAEHQRADKDTDDDPKRQNRNTESVPRASGQTEIQTADMGIRVVCDVQHKARGRGRGRGKGGTSKIEKTRARKRNTQQYQWSTVGRDAFNVAQTNNYHSTKDRSGSNGTRFERGEGGGVT